MLKKSFITVCVVSFLLLGCSSDVKKFHTTKSLGEELEDLDKAYKNNAISEDEYKKAKEMLINRSK